MSRVHGGVATVAAAGREGRGVRGPRPVPHCADPTNDRGPARSGTRALPTSIRTSEFRILTLGADYSLDLGNMLVQSDGAIVLPGTARATAAPALDMHVLRLGADGDLDSSGSSLIGCTTIDFLTAASSTLASVLPCRTAPDRRGPFAIRREQPEFRWDRGAPGQ